MEVKPNEADPKYKMEFAQKSQVNTLAEFQLNLAMETETMQLDRQIVRDAINYFFDEDLKEGSNELGIYLVKLREEAVIGMLLLTFESQTHWWIQSVYVISEERRKGHFTSIFQEAASIGRQRKAKSIKLYVETENERAQNTYKKLGMSVTKEKMHSYDFVYAKTTLDDDKSEYTVEKVKDGKELLGKWVENKQNILTGQKYQEMDWNTVYVIKQGDKICGVSKLFPQFSDWRFGLMWYFRQLYVEEGHQEQYQTMFNVVMKTMLQEGGLKVAAIRMLFWESQKLQFKGGHLEPYYIMELKL